MNAKPFVRPSTVANDADSAEANREIVERGAYVVLARVVAEIADEDLLWFFGIAHEVLSPELLFG